MNMMDESSEDSVAFVLKYLLLYCALWIYHCTVITSKLDKTNAKNSFAVE